jgi:hypothetical protein
MSACKPYPKYQDSGVEWLFRPNGASYLSPGQRPGSGTPQRHPALKGRPNR